MDAENMKQRISSAAPAASFEVDKEFLYVIIPADNLFTLIKTLKTDPDLSFNHLSCLTCIDRNPEFYMIYILQSFEKKHEIVVKAKISGRSNPAIESVSSLWSGAELLEREVFDFFGIKFNNHPDLRRLFLADDWNGFPLRKDYADEVNIENRN
ncbi:MAG: NADH-quinone oxidoreductase subunit C [Bacteroidetes bacterium]|nr:NADH-quinone oxidoreductase subunit C [Bacteroidota bacterium]